MKEQIRREYLSRIYWNAIVGIVAMILLMGVRLVLDGTGVGEELGYANMGMIQRTMGVLHGAPPVDTRVVGIDALALRRSPTSLTGDAETPRGELWSAIETVAKLHPLAIGVDVEFSPTDSGYVDPVADLELFYNCLRLSRVGIPGVAPRTPVFLGVHRAGFERFEVLLGSAAFASLAASIHITTDDKSKMLIESIPVGQLPSVAEPCSSMGVRLAAVALVDSLQSKWFEGNFWISRSEEESVTFGDLAVREARVCATDFSAIPRMKVEALRIEDIDIRSADQIAGKLILLGDTNPETNDRFDVPGRHRQDIPGVFLHASLARTLVQGPLALFTVPGRIVLEFLLTLCAIVLFLTIQLGFLKWTGRLLLTHRLQALLGWIVVALQFVVGFLLVAWTRILWDDFLISIPFLFLSPRLEEWLGPLLKQFPGKALANAKTLVEVEPEPRR